MLTMTREEILHLASLARIKLTDEELQGLETDLPKILDYVSVVSDIVGTDVDLSPEIGARYNVFREDEITNEPAEYTEALLGEMPETDGQFLKVKKILNTED